MPGRYYAAKAMDAFMMGTEMQRRDGARYFGLQLHSRLVTGFGASVLRNQLKKSVLVRPIREAILYTQIGTILHPWFHVRRV